MCHTLIILAMIFRPFLTVNYNDEIPRFFFEDNFYMCDFTAETDIEKMDCEFRYTKNYDFVKTKLNRNICDSDVWFDMGLATSERGDFKTGIQIMQIAYQLNPYDQSITYFLGDFYLRYANWGSKPSQKEDLLRKSEKYFLLSKKRHIEIINETDNRLKNEVYPKLKKSINK